MSPKSTKQYVFWKLIKIKTISLTSPATSFIGLMASAHIVTDQAWNSRILWVRLRRAGDGNLIIKTCLEYNVNQMVNLSSAGPNFKRSLQMKVIYNVRNACLEVLYKADAFHEDLQDVRKANVDSLVQRPSKNWDDNSPTKGWCEQKAITWPVMRSYSANQREESHRPIRDKHVHNLRQPPWWR